MLELDQILKANEINFAILAALPAFFLSLLLLMLLRARFKRVRIYLSFYLSQSNFVKRINLLPGIGIKRYLIIHMRIISSDKFSLSKFPCLLLLW